VPEALDWTVAVDDMMTERHQTCITCGQPAKKGDYVEVGGLVLAIGRCARCYEQDPDGTALCRRLEQRDPP
jgi:hypothetical protein